MTIFQHKKTKKLYTIDYVKLPKYTGSWYEEKPYKWEGSTIKNINLKDFIKISWI